MFSLRSKWRTIEDSGVVLTSVAKKAHPFKCQFACLGHTLSRFDHCRESENSNTSQLPLPLPQLPLNPQWYSARIPAKERNRRTLRLVCHVQLVERLQVGQGYGSLTCYDFAPNSGDIVYLRSVYRCCLSWAIKRDNQLIKHVTAYHCIHRSRCTYNSYTVDQLCPNF